MSNSKGRLVKVATRKIFFHLMKITFWIFKFLICKLIKPWKTSKLSTRKKRNFQLVKLFSCICYSQLINYHVITICCFCHSHYISFLFLSLSIVLLLLINLSKQLHLLSTLLLQIALHTRISDVKKGYPGTINLYFWGTSS